MTKKISVEAQLKAPFPLADLEWRVGSTFADGSKGILLPFVTARAIQERLDQVFGVEGWKNKPDIYEQGVVCTLTATTADGKVIEKADGAEFSQVSGLKGGISGALKRAASAMGIGRYLYDLPVIKVDLDRKKFKGKVVALPDEFVPESERTGVTEVKIEYFGFAGSDGGYNNHRGASSSAPIGNVSEDEIKAAMDFVVRNDKYNEGKKMSEVWEKSLRFLANGRDKEQARAARIVAQHKGITI